MSTITAVVNDTLDERGYGQYKSYASPVVEALEEREEGIVAAIREVCSERGIGEHEADTLLERVGLREPEPTVEDAAPTSESGLADLVRSLSEKVDRLFAAAQRNGISV